MCEPVRVLHYATLEKIYVDTKKLLGSQVTVYYSK